MAQWVSFDEVKSQVGMRDVLAHYGLMQGSTEKKTKRGTELRLRCPFHEDTTPSLSISAETGKFHCFGCSAKGGDIFDFVVAKEGIAAGDRTQSRRKAALLIQDWFGLKSEAAPASEKSAAAEISVPVEDVTDATPAPEAPEAGTNPPLTFTFRHLDNRHPYLTQTRELSAATIDTFGLGYHAGKGIMHGRIVIPIHNEQGELVAYAGRWPADAGWPAGEDKCRVEPVVTHPAPPQTRTCAIHAYGSSGRAAAALMQSPGVPWSGLVSSKSLPCLRPADALPDGAFPPVGRLGLTSPLSSVLCAATTATSPSRRASLVARRSDTLCASVRSWCPRRARSPGGSPRSRQGF